MKKVLSLIFVFVGFALIFSNVVFSENIAGFPFGEKFTDYQKFTELKNQQTAFPHEYQADNVKFFDLAQIGTDENRTIRSIAFQKEYVISVHNVQVTKVKILEDFQRMLGVLEKKYGVFDKTKAKRILGYQGQSNSFFMSAVAESAVNMKPKSSKVGAIYIMLDSPEDKNFFTGSVKKVTFSLAYMDNAFVKQIKQEKEDELSDF